LSDLPPETPSIIGLAADGSRAAYGLSTRQPAAHILFGIVGARRKDVDRIELCLILRGI
jgi:hypothetical protein